MATDMATDNRIAPNVELVYDRDCPNVGDCRDALRSALTEFGAQLLWHEWDRNSAGTPTVYRNFGSPTILVNGRDIHTAAQAVEPEGNSCRVYANDVDGGFSGSPSVSSIVNALIAATNDDPIMRRNIPSGIQSGAHTASDDDECAC